MYSVFWLFIYVLNCCLVYRLGRFVFNFCCLVYIYWIAPRLGIGFKFHLYKDKWTVVTGSTDGIGKEYLRQLAEKGLRKFVLVSRDKKKLDETAQWLSEIYSNCEIRNIAFTFGRDSYDILREELATLDIGILVNNAGTAPSLMHRFSEDPDTDRLIFKVNTESVFEMMQIVLPKMRSAKCGAIVNVSSLQSIKPIRLIASYSASKAYISYLTACSHREYSGDGITIQCLIPIVVNTKMLNYRPGDINVFDRLILVSTDQYAKEAINTLGVTSYTTGCWWQELQYALIYLIPWWMLRVAAERYYLLHQRRLLRAYKKSTAQ